MPRKHKKSKRTFRRRRKKTSTAQVIRQPYIVADKQIVTMKFAQYVSLNCTATTPAYENIRCGSIYDPWYPTENTQSCISFNEWMSFYDRYTVLSSKCSFYAEVYDTTAGAAVIAYVDVVDLPTASISNADHALEKKGCRTKFLTHANSAKSFGTVRGYYNPKKHFGVKDVEDVPTLSATSITNPAKEAYFQVGVVALNPLDNPAPVNCRVVVTYNVLLHHPKDLLQS